MKFSAGWIFAAGAAVAGLLFLMMASEAQRIHREHLVTCTNKVNSLEAEVRIQKTLLTEARLAATHYERGWKTSETNFVRTTAILESTFRGLEVITNQIEVLKCDLDRTIAERDHYKDLVYQLLVPADLKKELGVYSLNTNTQPPTTDANSNK